MRFETGVTVNCMADGYEALNAAKQESLQCVTRSEGGLPLVGDVEAIPRTDAGDR